MLFTNTLWRHATPSEVGQAGTRDGAKEQVALSAVIEHCAANLFWSKNNILIIGRHIKKCSHTTVE